MCWYWNMLSCILCPMRHLPTLNWNDIEPCQILSPWILSKTYSFDWLVYLLPWFVHNSTGWIFTKSWNASILGYQFFLHHFYVFRNDEFILSFSCFVLVPLFKEIETKCTHTTVFLWNFSKRENTVFNACSFYHSL